MVLKKHIFSYNHVIVLFKCTLCHIFQLLNLFYTGLNYYMSRSAVNEASPVPNVKKIYKTLAQVAH